MRLSSARRRHHANLVPWLMVAEQTGARMSEATVAPDHTAGRGRAWRASTAAQPGCWRLARCPTSPAVCPDFRRFARPTMPGWWCGRRRARAVLSRRTFRRWISTLCFRHSSLRADRHRQAVWAKVNGWRKCRRGSAAVKRSPVTFDGFKPSPRPALQSGERPIPPG